MGYTTFNTIHGDIIKNPDIELLKILILYVGEEYWCLEGGQSVFSFDEGKSEKLLVLHFSQTYGFYLIYDNRDGKILVSLGGGDYNNVAKVYVGGDPLSVPSKFFIDREAMFTVLEDFLNTGGPSSAIEWGIQKEIGWNYFK